MATLPPPPFTHSLSLSYVLSLYGLAVTQTQMAINCLGVHFGITDQIYQKGIWSEVSICPWVKRGGQRAHHRTRWGEGNPDRGLAERLGSRQIHGGKRSPPS